MGNTDRGWRADLVRAREGRATQRSGAYAVGDEADKAGTRISLYRTAVHEISGHTFIAFALEIPIAQVSITPDGKGNLGETRHATYPTPPSPWLSCLLAKLPKLLSVAKLALPVLVATVRKRGRWQSGSCESRAAMLTR